MANQEHLDILKQGTEIWNEWRKMHTEVKPDLDDADLNGTHLSIANLWNANIRGANLSRADLSGANIRGANLTHANLSWTDLMYADLSGANLTHANLSCDFLESVNLTHADLRDANLSGADLRDVDLRDANLTHADLSGADLQDADLWNANLSGADLSGATIRRAIFGNIDLSVVKGLETVKHSGPSTIGIDTIYRSHGNIPEAFLKGAGVDDTFITYIHSLVGKPIEYYSCFISYSSEDEAFAKRLYVDLQSHNVRCWFAPEDIKIGDRIRDRIDQSIRLYDKLLLILSEQSVMSDWVEDEVEAAMEKERLARERAEEQVVLFPVRLDEAVKTTTKAWAAKLRRQRHIGDFSSWKHHDEYQKAFNRLLRDLKAAP